MTLAALRPPLPDQRLAPFATERLLPVGPHLGELFPGGALCRGSVVALGGRGAATSLLCALLAEPLLTGAFGALVGFPEFGFEAAAGYGVPLERLAVVPAPGRAWPEVTAVLLECCAIVAIGPCGPCRAGEARRLLARAREHGTVMIVLEAALAGHRPDWWPEAPDVRLEARPTSWRGIGAGFGTLVSREVEVVVSGRRGAGRSRCVPLWLPSPAGEAVTRSAPFEFEERSQHRSAG